MDKIVAVKRKAQQLVQSGDLTRAISEYKRLVDAGEMDPYDFVYLGDLLTRVNRPNEAVERYRDAIAAYERVGLYKNAIAVGKKILRIKPESIEIHKLLGALYFQDGLFNDSLFYYMQFLSAAPVHSEAVAIEEVGIRLLGMPLPSPDVALSIVACMGAANCAHHAARPLLALAQEFEQRGEREWAEPLKRRAFDLDPNLKDELEAASASAAPGGGKAEPDSEEAPAGPPPLVFDSTLAFVPPSPDTREDSLLERNRALSDRSKGDGEITVQHGYHDSFGNGGTEPAAMEPEAPDPAEARDGLPADRGDEPLPAGNGTPAAGEGPSPGPAVGPGPSQQGPGDFGMLQLDGKGDEAPVYEIEDTEGEDGPGDDGRAARAGNSGQVGTDGSQKSLEALLAEDSDLQPHDFRAMVKRGHEHLGAGDEARGFSVLLAAARVAFNAGESRVAETVYSEMVKIDPNHLEALQGLAEIAHINGERSKIVRYGCELGDVLLAREQYAAAKLEFERVLQFDPRNEKARARVNRLNSIDGMEHVTAQPLAPVASEVQGASVSVRGEPARTQSILDLSEIMNEFQSAVASQFPADDAQSHYDLGMTYHEMGMIEQAVSEFEIAARSPLYRGRSTEMIARCLISAGRAEEALTLVDEATADASHDPERQAALFACRGLALEALGRTPEAIDSMRNALLIDPALVTARDAMARLGGSPEEMAA